MTTSQESDRTRSPDEGDHQMRAVEQRERLLGEIPAPPDLQLLISVLKGPFPLRS